MRTLPVNRYRLGTLLLLAAAACTVGCATTISEPAQLSCAQLDKEIRVTKQARSEAVEKQQDPFKFVLPLTVGGVHVASASAVASADRWLAELREESTKKGCSSRV